MFFNGGTIITLRSFPSDYQNSQVITDSGLKMPFSFASKGTTVNIINNFHHEVDELKKKLYKNGYPLDLNERNL